MKIRIKNLLVEMTCPLFEKSNIVRKCFRFISHISDDLPLSYFLIR